MTPEDLQRLIVAGDWNALAEALAPLSEAERRRLSAAAWELRTRLARRGFAEGIDSVLKRGLNWLLPHFKSAKTTNVDWCAKIALLGVGPLGKAKHVGMGEFNERAWPALIKVLDDRRPDWADEWLEHLLGPENARRTACWKPMRELIRRGVCRKPTSEAYIRCLADEIRSTSWSRSYRKLEPWIHEHLRNEPDLADDVWGLFEVETFGLFDVSSIRGDDGFAASLRALADNGALDRGRMLDTSLAALSRDLSAKLLSGMAAFHESLGPTEDEVSQRQSAYLDLLSAREKQVVAFGVKMLKRSTLTNRSTIASLCGLFRASSSPPQRARQSASSASCARSESDRRS